MTDNSNSAIAFIGLGNMGGPMAGNLAAAGHQVHGFDVGAEALATAREAGIDTFDSVPAAVEGAGIVITMLPNGALVDSVVTEALTVAKPGTLFIDCSTISVEDATDVHDKVTAAGSAFIDAPVSGGVTGAAAGGLAFMVGGDADDISRAAPLFDVMGRAVTHCGPVGAGQAAKLCNNMVLAIQQLAIGEAMVLGEKLGLSAESFHSVVSNSTGSCWALTTNCPVPGPVPTSPANDGFRPGFATALMVKDLGLAMGALDATGAAAPLGRTAAEKFREFADAGNAHLDFSAIIDTLRTDPVRR
ncbi:3-hydroxyisobutyrate dehydrogenase [Corynebacterium hansenii]|uniref:3-hydroxyisobutyrate dehydrogenase n=1 Tax=Corynebacterium hansenii TaxID=394964 RepID=A0ABV7ZKG4_9CORY|nr:3-hydroxyisobutyrate dehydrogenase [Corynebacterium hansenii]WJY99413.1 3-hydroxyisobutyrate dehydrogenase [Corynebacterium hansenii]